MSISMIFALGIGVAFLCGCCIGCWYGKKCKRAEIESGLNGLLENGDIKVFIRKGAG